MLAGHVGKLNQPLGLPLAGGKVDAGGAYAGAGVHGGELADHGVGRIDACFGFCGARLGSAAQPFNLGPHLVAQALLLAALRFEIGLSLLKEAAEVALHAQAARRHTRDSVQ